MTGRVSARLSCVLLACSLWGCANSTVSRHVVDQELCAGRFVELMGAGETTRKEEQDFIRASERAWHFLREAMGIERVEASFKEETDGKDQNTPRRKADSRRAR